MEINSRFKNFIAKHITQADDFSKQNGLKKSDIIAWQNGTIPNTNQIRTLSKIFHLSPYEIFGFSEDMTGIPFDDGLKNALFDGIESGIPDRNIKILIQFFITMRGDDNNR